MRRFFVVKIALVVSLLFIVTCFAPQSLAKNDGDEGLFERFYAERKNNPRFAELKQLREQFKEEMRQRPADKSKLRDIYRKMSTLKQAMADDAFEKFLVNLDKRETKRESIKQEKREERQNSRKKTEKRN